MKQKYLWANEASFKTKEFHRETVKRLILHNNFLRPKSQEDKLEYNKRQKFCKKLLKTTNSCTLVI